MEPNRFSVLMLILAIAMTVIVVGGGVYFWQKSQATRPQAGATVSVIKPPIKEEPTDPLLYSIDGVSTSVSKKIAMFDYTVDQLKGAAKDCGSKHDTNYFDQLVPKFSNTTKIIYNFKYTGASQESDTFTVTLLQNKAGYTSLEQFKKDFDICAAGGDAYPMNLNSNWLLFVSSCGSGVDDGSGRSVGCDKVRQVVEPSLKLN